ncbi:MAG: phosphoribosylformylglycinamidine cyclo-ligase [Deltaproteobacteria bacterium]|nr:phosphoribosylformylglycinamidine cyclo-ligase [Deltaproteobacteria bacterium]
MKITYEQSGVDYAKIDPLKILAQQAAKATAHNLLAAGVAEVEESRGESAYVVDVGEFYLASITECLGTKALVADAMRQITGKTYYDHIAQDTLAMAINDIITVGARPLSVHAYWATGGSNWFSDEQRMKDLVDGWQRTCNVAGVAWGGGETPSLAGVVAPGAIDLAASCVGIIRPKTRLTVGRQLQPGDAIILLESSGIHANGVSLARTVAEQLPEGYRSLLSDGRMYGEALLDPTIIYSGVTEALFAEGVAIHYLANITGHGWRKLMRHPASFTYRLTTFPPVPPVLQFLVEKAGLDAGEAYGSLNMGAGFAVFVPESDAQKTVEVVTRCGLRAYRAGQVEAGKKQVMIEPLAIVYEGESLQVRA